MHSDQVTALRLRTLDGDVFINARDLTARIREIGNESRTAAEAYGDPIDDPDVNYPTVLAFHAIAVRLDELADRIDLAIIAHVSEG